MSLHLSRLFLTRENQWIHSVSPDEAWKEGLGWIVRLRTIIGVSIADFVSICVALRLGAEWYVWATIALIGLTAIACLLVLRRVWTDVVYVGASLHRLCDSMREDVAKIIAVAISPSPGSVLVYTERSKQFHNDVCDRIADFFRHMLKDHSINCAIRLASQKDGSQAYKTSGWSKGMILSRREESAAIPDDKGVARYLRQRKKRGVFIVRDIPKAIEDGVWLPTPTDTLPDVITQIIVPINGYVFTPPMNDGLQESQTEKIMIGLLHITSMKNVFQKVHLEPAMAIADILGLVYPMIGGNRFSYKGVQDAK